MRSLPWRPFVVGLLLSVAVGYALRPSEPAAPPSASPAPASAAPDSATSAGSASAPAAGTAGTPIARAGGTLRLDRASFPATGPVRVSLELPVTSADGEPRPVRMMSQDQRALEIPGALDSSRTAATIEVDPGYLQPGTYLVEVQTTEQSHFPLRRYFIVVR